MIGRETRGYAVSARAAFEPIVDEHSYKEAIEILDRLFHLRREKTAAERALFRELAELASEYECRNHGSKVIGAEASQV
jgi:antitoxin component HigA of HigAB toxin-antitoxin module